MKKKTWIIIATAVVVVGVTGLLYTQSRPTGKGQSGSIQPVNALKFKTAREDLSNTVEVKGKSSYQQETYVNAPFGADVKAWQVKDGAQVSKGAPLFQLDGTSLRNDIAQLEANIKKQEMDIKINSFERTIDSPEVAAAGISEVEAKQRFAQNETRRMQQEINQLNLKHAQTQLSEKSAKLHAAQFTAPESGIFLFDGTKEPKSVKENERIGRVVDLTKLHLIAYVGEFDLFRLKEGMPVQVRVDALKDVKLQGKVERLSKFAKNNTSSDNSQSTAAAEFEVVISLEPNERLIAGLSLTASIETDKIAGALVIPTLAVYRDKDESYVMLEAASGQLERRTVKVGLETSDKTEILSGVSEGDTVVIQ